MESSQIFVFDTYRFDHWSSLLDQGTTALEQEFTASRGTFSSGDAARLAPLMEFLFAVAKSLTEFLFRVRFLYIRFVKARSCGIRRRKNLWAINSMMDLRLQCLRYSVAVLRIANALELKAVNRQNGYNSDRYQVREPIMVDIPESQADSTSGLMTTPTRSFETNAGSSAVGSRSLASSPASEAFSNSEHESHFWEPMGCGTVQTGEITAGWDSSESDSSDEYPSHW